jgi:hypothetical protein
MTGFRDGFSIDLTTLKPAQLSNMLNDLTEKANRSPLVEVQTRYRSRADEVLKELRRR